MPDQDEVELVRQTWTSLGLPGIIDVHTHFMPKRVMEKVWAYFDSAGPLTARLWPIEYRIDEPARVEMLRQFGVRRFTSLVYAHKPDMAAWLNEWAARFASDTPDCLSTATFYPEPDAARYVTTAIDGGVRVFKVHIQVGNFDANNPLLERVWGAVAEAAVPVVIHCGSGPQPGAYTGPEPIRRLLGRHPKLRLIVAHMGMPEYAEFFDICEDFPDIRLDTTMAFTSFVDDMMPFPDDQRHRLVDLQDRILFGSDFPNIPHAYPEALGSLTGLGLGDDWLRKVLYYNAAEVFAV